MAKKKPLGTQPGPLGTVPWGQFRPRVEDTGVEPIIDVYRPWIATDARSVLVYIPPNHWNFFPNPCLRTDGTGWEVTDGEGAVQPIADLLSADSWVGQSINVNGDGTVRYRDDGYYVYTGPVEDLNGAQEWFEEARGSAEWRFSVYAKGKGIVRLKMRAHYSEDWDMAKSPPMHWNTATPGGEDGMWDYGTGPYVIGTDGHVWQRNEPPFYNRIGTAAMSSIDPKTLTPAYTMEPVILSTTGAVWERTGTTAPYYTEWGVAEVVEDPANIPAGEEYVQDEEGGHWQLLPGATEFPYYLYMGPLTVVSSPSGLVPDPNRMPSLLAYGGGIYQSRAAAPWYESIGTYTRFDAYDPESVDPEEEPPGLGLLYGTDMSVWKEEEKPWYTSTGQEPYFEEIATQEIEIDTDDWVRLWVRTGETDGTTATSIVKFPGVRWIDATVEFGQAENLLLSAFMLDPNEFPFAEYFDGGMPEPVGIENFLWEDPDSPDNSVSMYYYDRNNRFRWLWDHLPMVVPVTRPIQIYMGSQRRPYVPSAEAATALSANRTLTL